MAPMSWMVSTSMQISILDFKISIRTYKKHTISIYYIVQLYTFIQVDTVLVIELYFHYFFFNKILENFDITHKSFQLAQGQDLWRITNLRKILFPDFK